MNVLVHSPHLYQFIRWNWLQCTLRTLPHHQSTLLPAGVESETHKGNIQHVNSQNTGTTPVAHPANVSLKQFILPPENSPFHPFLPIHSHSLLTILSLQKPPNFPCNPQSTLQQQTRFKHSLKSTHCPTPKSFCLIGTCGPLWSGPTYLLASLLDTPSSCAELQH